MATPKPTAIQITAKKTYGCWRVQYVATGRNGITEAFEAQGSNLDRERTAHGLVDLGARCAYKNRMATPKPKTIQITAKKVYGCWHVQYAATGRNGETEVFEVQGSNLDREIDAIRELIAQLEARGDQ